jgi:hypothetical protein
MNYSKLIIIALIIYATHSAAEGITVKKLLATATTTRAVSMQRDQASALKNTWAGLPLIQDFEARVRNDAFLQEQFQFNFRVTPNGLGEGFAQRRLYRSEKNLVEQNVQVQIHNALLDRYSAMVEFLSSQTLSSIYAELETVLEDRVKVLQKSTYTTDFDLQNVIQAENDLTKAKDDYTQAVVTQRTYLWKIRQLLSDTGFVGFDTSGIVTVEAISERVRNSSIGSDSENVHLNNLRLKALVSESEFKVEKAKTRRYISQLSFTYDYGAYMDEIDKKLRYKGYDLNARYGVQVGVKLPFLSFDGRDAALRKARSIGDKADYAVTKQELIYKIERDIKDIEALITNYRFLMARQTEVNAQGSLQKYLKMSGVDPLMALSIKQGLLQNQLRIEKVRSDIFRNYIQILDETGQLSRLPLINYLSATKESIAK